MPWQWEILAEVDSTNRLALERVLDRWHRGQPADGLVIMAHRQHAGRGQHGRRWESPDGGLYLSAIVEEVPFEIRDRLALVAGIAAAEALAANGIPVKIRWPNDLVIGEKKVAGILCEAVAQGEKWAAVIGIGVNVNTSLEHLPPDLQKFATSLHAFDATERSAQQVGTAIVERLAHWLTRAREEGLSPIVHHVRTADALLGKKVRFQSGNDHFEATARGIDDAGQLLLQKIERGGEPSHPILPYNTGSVLAILPS